MKVLVTGSAGFIGFHTVNRLLNNSHEVVGLDNINDYYDPELKYARLKETGIQKADVEWHRMNSSASNPNYRFVRMNLEDKEQLFKLFEQENFDIAINLAAQAGVRYSLENPDAYIQSNIVGFLNILEACRTYKTGHLIYASSSSVYGNSSKMPLSVDDQVDNPVSLYAATKKSNELMAHTYSHLFNIPTTGLRFFTVYGPWGRPDMAPILFANAITKGETIKVFNQGDLERDFTYIHDIVEGLIRIVESGPHKPELSTEEADKKSPVPYSVYNIGNGNPVRLMDFIKTMEEAFKREVKKNYLPMQPGDVYKTYADVSQLKANYNYHPNTSLKEGIESFAKWFKGYYLGESQERRKKAQS